MNSKPHWKEILDELPAGVAILGRDGRILYVNKRILEKNRYLEEQIIKSNPTEFIAEEDREEAAIHLKNVLKYEFDKVPYPLTFRFKTRNGRIHWDEVRYTPVKFADENALILVFTDVTEKIKLQKKISKLNEYLRFLNKMLRHDILNLFTSISGYLEIYNESCDRKMLENIQKIVDRGVRLIHQIKELESMSDTKTKPVNVRGVFEEVMQSYPAEYSISGDSVVLADQGFNSVVSNIVENAIKHGNAKRISVDIKEKEGVTEIRIADDGRGIPEEIRDRIFEEGFRYGEKEGSGLGLYIVKTLIESYGGEIKVEPNEPRGTVFVIRVPSLTS